jgi:hypothetical protein
MLLMENYFANHFSNAEKFSPYMILGEWETVPAREHSTLSDCLILSGENLELILDIPNAAAFFDLSVRGPINLNHDVRNLRTEVFTSVIESVVSDILKSIEPKGLRRVAECSKIKTANTSIQSRVNGCRIYLNSASKFPFESKEFAKPIELDESWDGQIFIPEIAFEPALKLYNIIREEYPPLQYIVAMRLAPESMRAYLGYLSDEEVANFFYFVGMVDLVGPAVLKPLERYICKEMNISATEVTNGLYRPFSSEDFAAKVIHKLGPFFEQSIRILSEIDGDYVRNMNEIARNSDFD